MAAMTTPDQPPLTSDDLEAFKRTVVARAEGLVADRDVRLETMMVFDRLPDVVDALEAAWHERDTLRTHEARRRAMLKYVSGRLLDLEGDTAALVTLRYEIDAALEAVDREQVDAPGVVVEGDDGH